MASKTHDEAALTELTRAMYINERGGGSTRAWLHIDACLQTCCRHIWLVRELGKMRNSAGDTVRPPDVVVKFYNEMVCYIVGGTRSIRVETWASILDAALPDKPATRQVAGNIGSQIVDAFFGAPSETTPALMQVSVDKIRRDLLNMPENEIIYMWMMRPNGLDDMIRTLPMVARIYDAILPLN